MRNLSHPKHWIATPHRSTMALPPGSIDPEAAPPCADDCPVTTVRYGPDRLEESESTTVEHVPDKVLGSHEVVWIDVEGAHDHAALRRIATARGWHGLVLEDVVSLHQRPKVDRFDGYLFMVLYVPSADGSSLVHLSLVVGEGYVVTVAGAPIRHVTHPLRRRLRESTGRIRTAGPDYLAFAIVDAVLDFYFPLVEDISARLEAMERTVVADGDFDAGAVYAMRGELHLVWRRVAATREAIEVLVSRDTTLMTEATQVYLRDSRDHCSQLLDVTAACLELSGGLQDLHLALVNTKTSETTQLLTVVATLFMPLGFIVGLYGMNFDTSVSPLNMPELGLYAGYPLLLGFMLTLTLSLLWFFKRRGWLG